MAKRPFDKAWSALHTPEARKAMKEAAVLPKLMARRATLPPSGSVTRLPTIYANVVGSYTDADGRKHWIQTTGNRRRCDCRPSCPYTGPTWRLRQITAGERSVCRAN